VHRKREPGPVSEEKPELNRGSVQPGTIGVHDRMTKTESLLAAQCSRPQQPSCATRPGVGVHASSRFWFSVAHTRKPDHGRPATKAGSGLRPTALVSFIPAGDKGKPTQRYPLSRTSFWSRPTAAVSFITNFILKSTPVHFRFEEVADLLHRQAWGPRSSPPLSRLHSEPSSGRRNRPEAASPRHLPPRRRGRRLRGLAGERPGAAPTDHAQIHAQADPPERAWGPPKQGKGRGSAVGDRRRQEVGARGGRSQPRHGDAREQRRPASLASSLGTHPIPRRGAGERTTSPTHLTSATEPSEPAKTTPKQRSVGRSSSRRHTELTPPGWAGIRVSRAAMAAFVSLLLHGRRRRKGAAILVPKRQGRRVESDSSADAPPPAAARPRADPPLLLRGDELLCVCCSASTGVAEGELCRRAPPPPPPERRTPGGGGGNKEEGGRRPGKKTMAGVFGWMGWVGCILMLTSGPYGWLLVWRRVIK
jgi:hypothetical protein